MYQQRRITFRNILIFTLAVGVFFFLPLCAMAENDDEEETTVEEYVNPFLEENLALYEEAMALQGYIVPGLAYLDDTEGEDQPDGIAGADFKRAKLLQIAVVVG